TFVRKGLVDHADSMGAGARYGRGDTQWLTAGGGIQHAEMFPLLDPDGPNHLELFQIWLNLPAADKMVAPHFTMLWAEDQPTVVMDSDGRAEVTVIAGELRGVVPPPPPPASYASRPDSDVAIWHIVMSPNASFELPAARSAETLRVLYFFEGDELHVGPRTVPGSTGLALAGDQAVRLATRMSGVECLMLQARPIGEPVARQGPFVMNTRDEILQAYRDYQRTEFGGWPWPVPDPTHGPDPRRFAQHADGRIEEPEATSV
ncbi:MAG TPA: pirin-like C-terminal cupin domain-containing protein, partial [Acidimicrobiales bacterium]